MSTRAVELEIRGFIADNFLLGQDAEVRDDASLTREGVIDSVGVVELMQFLETRYNIVIADEEAVPENLDSIGSIVRYLDAKGVTAVPSDPGIEPGDIHGVARR